MKNTNVIWDYFVIVIRLLTKYDVVNKCDGRLWKNVNCAIVYDFQQYVSSTHW